MNAALKSTPRVSLYCPISAALAAVRSEAFPAHLLVVDDNDAMRELLAEWFRRAGYRVTTAENGEAAWDILCVESVDVLVTDHDMPKLTGLQLLRRVRAGPLRLPVILVSGDMPWNEADLLPLLPPGLALEKPFTLAELLAQVDGLLAPIPFPREYCDGQTLLNLYSAQSPLTVRAAG